MSSRSLNIAAELSMYVYNIIDKYMYTDTSPPTPNRPETAGPADNCRVIRFDEVCARPSPGHSIAGSVRDRRSSIVGSVTVHRP
jgi:hypothetical protein